MEIRPLRGWEEFRACETFQRRVWGEDFSEVAPASLLKIARRIGGVSSGAFHPEEGLVGFVYGLTGVEDGELVHWSHMLAVRRDFRDEGLGRRLKEHQREMLLEEGVGTVYWTFDPLVARNAHFNLNRLGVTVEEYVPQMYGETGSRLHQGLGTDRFLVSWDLAAYRPGEGDDARDEEDDARDGSDGAGAEPPAAEAGPGDVLPDELRGDAGLPSHGSEASGVERPAPPVLRIEIPSDIHAVREDDPAAAAEWRERTRDAFLARLETGYRVLGFVPGPGRGFYVLAREDVEPDGGLPFGTTA